jgi:hypothetical protein
MIDVRSILLAERICKSLLKIVRFTENMLMDKGGLNFSVCVTTFVAR